MTVVTAHKYRRGRTVTITHAHPHNLRVVEHMESAWATRLRCSIGWPSMACSLQPSAPGLRFPGHDACYESVRMTVHLISGGIAGGGGLSWDDDQLDVTWSEPGSGDDSRCQRERDSDAPIRSLTLPHSGTTPVLWITQPSVRIRVLPRQFHLGGRAG